MRPLESRRLRERIAHVKDRVVRDQTRVMRSVGGSQPASERSVKRIDLAHRRELRALAPREPVPFRRAAAASGRTSASRPRAPRRRSACCHSFAPMTSKLMRPRQLRGQRAALQRVIEPLISKLAQIDPCRRIDLVIAQHRRGECAVLDDTVVIGTDQQRVVGMRVVAMMLREIIERRRLAVVEIARRGEHRDVEVRELLAERHHRLPEPVVARMVQPADEDRVGPAEYAARDPDRAARCGTTSR